MWSTSKVLTLKRPTWLTARSSIIICSKKNCAINSHPVDSRIYSQTFHKQPSSTSDALFNELTLILGFFTPRILYFSSLFRCGRVRYGLQPTCLKLLPDPPRRVDIWHQRKRPFRTIQSSYYAVITSEMKENETKTSYTVWWRSHFYAVLWIYST